MRLDPGDTLGPYSIIAPVGRGGMGEVYRARDTRIDRTVAIKVLAGTAASAGATLEQEARFIAALNHPHICGLYDIGRERDTPFLVMEFIEGQSLAQRLEEGRLSHRDAIRYSIQIAEALDHAHRQGVLHRDLKPANIMLTRNSVKVLDFGVATLRQRVAFSDVPLDRTPVAASSTLSTDQSVLGSVHYLAPERLNGGDADVASDLFALGAVMYEMATGTRPFEGPTAAAVVAAILEREPAPPSAVDPTVPATFEWVIQKALAKNPEHRWQGAGDIVEVLRWAARTPGGAVAPASPPRRRNPLLLPLLVTAAIVAGGGIFGYRALRSGIPAAPSLMFSIYPPASGGFTLTTSSVQSPQFALSPDGQQLAFVASVGQDPPQLWVRELRALNPEPLAGTHGAEYPFWSPDGQSIGFFAGRMLKRIDLAGGPPRELAPAPHGRGGAWSTGGVIIFAPSTQSGLFRIAASGGEAQPLTTVNTDGGEASHRWPQFLPDERHVLFFVQGTTPQGHGAYVTALDGTPSRRVRSTPLAAAFAAPNQLLFMLDDTLLAAPFDWKSARLAGEPVPVVSPVAGSSSFYAAFSASNNGLLVYAPSEASAELVWHDRNGHRTGAAVPAGQYADFRLGPDESQLALAEVDRETHRPDIRVLDLARGAKVRVTYDAATDASPTWSPDGQRLVFRSNRSGVHDLYERAANGSGESRLLLHTTNAKYPTDWAPDGRILFHAHTPESRADIWTMNPDGGDAKPIVNSPFDEVQGQISPDGKWIAYTSFEAGHAEVYVRSVTDVTLRWPVSAGGGSDPRWRGDGRELFYLSADLHVTAVRFEGGAPARPKPLFRVRVLPQGMPYLSNYDVSADGQRFLVKLPVHDMTSAPVHVLTNWQELRTPAR